MKKIILLLSFLCFSNVFAISINRIDVGDAYYINSNGTFHKVYVININESQNVVKVELSDGTIDWVNAGDILTRRNIDGVQSKRNILKSVKAKSLRLTEWESRKILNDAYPLAFNQLDFERADLVSAKAISSGYEVVTQLNYLNLFNNQHYVKIAFYYDTQGNGSYWKFVGHSDAIAPRELTIKTFLEHLNNQN